MADLHLKVTADTSQAAGEVRKLEATTRRVQQTMRQLDVLGSGLRSRFTQLRGAVGAAAGTFAAGGSAVEVLGSFIGDLSLRIPELAPIAGLIVGGRLEGAILDRLGLGLRPETEQMLGAPRSVVEAAMGINRAAIDVVGWTRWAGWRGSVRELFGGFEKERDKRRKDAFRKLARQSLPLAIAVLSSGQLDDTEGFNEILDEVRAEKKRAEQSKEFLNRYGDQPNVVNMYASIVAGGGRGSVGRQISSAQAIYARNNGRSVTTSSRRS